MKKSCKRLNTLTFLELKSIKETYKEQKAKRWNILCIGVVTDPILIAGFSHQILNPSQRMNENSQRVSFHLVLPSTSSHEIFLENHAGKFTVTRSKVSLGDGFSGTILANARLCCCH